MITLTSDELIRHELISLRATVKCGSNPLHEGINGFVVDETKNTLVIGNETGRHRIPKDGSSYVFTLANGLSIEVEGGKLLGRPVDRTGKTLGRK